MSTSRMLRIAGAVLLLGGLLGLIGTLASPTDPNPRVQVASVWFMPTAALSLLGGTLSVLAFPALYSRIAGRTGLVGLIGFAAIMVTGMAFGVFLSLLNLVVVPWLTAQPISDIALQEGPPALNLFFLIASLIALAGAVLFGIATIRSGVFSRWIGYLLIAAGVVNILTGFIPVSLGIVNNLGGVLLYLALGAYGYQLWHTHAEAELSAGEGPIQEEAAPPTLHDESQPRAA